MTARADTGSNPPAAPDATGAGEDRRRRRLRGWLRRHRGAAAFGAVLAVALGLVLWNQLAPKGDALPLSVSNAGPDGARAVTQILSRHGVRVHDARNFGTAMAALRDSDSPTLLLYDRAGVLDRQQISQLRRSSSRVVVVTPRLETLAGADTGIRQAGVVPDSAATLEPACSLPDAAAAGQVTGATGFVYDGETSCYRPAGSTAGLLAISGDVTVLGSTAILGNGQLDDLGHAALALRLLGGSADLVWYLPSLEDAALTDSAKTLDELAPDWVRFLGPWLVVVTLAAIAWRGRRMGPLVFEPLPVVVKAVETAEGRARLYHDAHATGQARDALRAGTLVRLAATLRLGPGAGAEETIDAAARLLRRPATGIRDLVNDHPRNEAALVAWARNLHTLENEVKNQ